MRIREHTSFASSIKLLISAIFSILMFCLLGFSWGKLPALAPLLNPFQGIWNYQPIDRSQGKILTFSALKNRVEVFWDENDIPHVKADNSHDLYFVQGYLTAQDRLFQMDIQSRLGGGRLAEVVGRRGLEMDRFYINLGLRRAVRRGLEEAKKNSQTWEALESFSEGVNAYIANLAETDWPIEYQLLNAKPSLWKPENTIELLKMMSFRLAGRSYDLFITKHLQNLGQDKVENLFPEFLAKGQDDFVILSTQQKSFVELNVQSPKELFQTAIKDFPKYLNPVATNGSNNWAVSAAKSQTGASLLANDTHLSYSLPAIWYEMQLSTPDETVYGATLPGSPGVIIGFTQKAAWAVTNGTTDVLDWYEVEFDSAKADRYLFENEWKNLEIEKELIEIKGESSEELLVRWTQQGAVMHQVGNLGLVSRWVALEPSNETKVFLNLNKSKSYDDCREALKLHSAPIQNFICADKDNIGIFHNGRIPIRWPNQGRYVGDGRRSQYDWQGWIPWDQLPYEENPANGFVRSANQRVIRAEYPYYLGWDYEDSYRGARIREFLESKDKFNIQDMIELQNDDLNLHAKRVCPDLLKNLQQEKLPTEMLLAFKDLSSWDFKDSEESLSSTVFAKWYEIFELNFWEPVLGPRQGNLFPKRQRTEELINNFTNKNDNDLVWLQSRTKNESFSDVVHKSFIEAWRELEKNYGSYGPNWAWKYHQKTQVPHMARIPGFGSQELLSSGSRYAVHANRGDHGPTWKMVLDLGNLAEGWVNYPGGQAGSPLDPRYGKFLESWAKGQMRKVKVLKSSEFEGRNNLWLFNPARGGQ